MQLVLEKRAERSNTIALISPLIAIGLTIVTMSILFVILGKNPISALGVYFIDPLTDSYSLQEIAVKASPLVMIAIGLSLCYLANAWNIGAEGQFLVGAVAGALLINWGKTVFSESFPELWLFAMGGLFIAVVLAFPRGLAGLVTDQLLPRLRNGGSGRAPRISPAPAE